MKYTVILNGCSSSFIHQAEEIRGFLSDNKQNPTLGYTIIFYNDEAKKDELMTNSPTTYIKLVKVIRYQPENFLEILEKLENNKETSLYIFPSDFAGSELSVRFAYRLLGSSLVSVNKIKLEKNELICHKALYSNNMQGEFALRKKPYCISIAKGFSNKKQSLKSTKYLVFKVDMTDIEKDDFIKKYDLKKPEKVIGLEDSKFLLAAGRGVRTRAKVERLEMIASEIGAKLGVSRPIAMNAWVPMNQLIGVSGAMTKPDLCIAVGVSGAAAFFAGIEKCKYIVAINTDSNASIVKSSNVAIIDDYQSVLEELFKIINSSQ